MIRSLYTGEAGIKTHQTRMDVIGNNVANVNTTGFKSGRGTFDDILSQTLKGATASNGTLGSTNPTQIGLGVKLSAVCRKQLDEAKIKITEDDGTAASK